eukprot:Sspe_Gene.69239::Locus_40810_Transcript_1_1_Confidence_1.000_Length_464::g.69239::m.69239
MRRGATVLFRAVPNQLQGGRYTIAIAGSRRSLGSVRKPPPRVAEINEAIETHPTGCILYTAGCRMAVWGVTYLVITSSGLSVPMDLALAYVLTRPLKRIRAPLELAVAVGLSKAFPVLSQFHIASLFSNIGPFDSSSSSSSS